MMDYSRYLVKKYEKTLNDLELKSHEQEIKFHKLFFKESHEGFEKCFERIKNLNINLLRESQTIKNEL
ncbi:hypothetical protein [Acinetobacter baumannii]|uniref:hypothetical protein n=1 Tax=Acinetobacter baumannii TaxID=470 RepID=UPI000DC71393|nr:hypothetical protein [Acinetobacter baumannii]ANS22252.1 hypothetical protein G424_13155 [Acinetobacter baumannii PR07]